MSCASFARVANCDVTAQGQGAQRWPSRTSPPFLVLMLNAGETPLCRPSLTQLLPGTVGRGGHKPRCPTISPSAHATAGGVVTVRVQSKPSKEDSNFCPLKRCMAAFLDHVQLDLQFLTHHRVLLGFIQAAEVISLTSLPYGLFEMLRN